MAMLESEWLGRQAYGPFWLRMQQRAKAVASGSATEIIWACEHEAVYTTGRRGMDNHLQEQLPAPLVRSDRGGEMTFHGPGQIMLYPVIHLLQHGLGVKQYVHLLEQSCINLLASLDVHAERRKGFPGVWRPTGKVAALGVRISRGVAFHGMALNVDVSAHWFAAINPCGLGKPAINLSDVIRPLPLPELAGQWQGQFTQLLTLMQPNVRSR